MHESVAATIAALQERLREIRQTPEAGVSMEQVVITAGLLAVALLVVAAITAAVEGRLFGIY